MVKLKCDFSLLVEVVGIESKRMPCPQPVGYQSLFSHLEAGRF